MQVKQIATADNRLCLVRKKISAAPEQTGYFVSGIYFFMCLECGLGSSGCPTDRGPEELLCFSLRYLRWVNPNFPVRLL